MYEQVTQSLLRDILDHLDPAIKQQELHTFNIRLGANFHSIYTLFQHLYGQRDDFELQVQNLISMLAQQYTARPEVLKQQDDARERDHNWFLHQRWVGMALYVDSFAGDLKGLKSRLPYFEELGVNMIHLMPVLEAPKEQNDGGYAVSNYREVDSRFGSMEDLKALISDLRQRDLLITLDIVVNHTSDEHEWAQKARQGDPKYQDYYYTFDDRTIPDQFEQSMMEIFPETSPGNFTWDKAMQKWVMTVFNHYQWDLNYSNPAVFIEMMDIILFIANQGADIVRLDAVAFLWKKIGSVSQNEREAHLILQLMKDCCQVVSPGVLFIAEAIVAPTEIIKYFGEDAINAKECEIAYNATYMALMWDALATKNTRLMYVSLKNLPDKLERATWLNYIRCHDDIGLGYDDEDIRKAGYNPWQHRKFLLDYYTGQYDGSDARGMPFGQNDKTGDARISGTLAALAGLEKALEKQGTTHIDLAIRRIIMLHSLIMAFGGIPMLYYGDEIGTLNDKNFLEDPNKAHDSRWAHRPPMDWDRAELRHQPDTTEFRIFNALKKMIAVRKTIAVFADFNNRKLIPVDNPHLLVFLRFDPQQTEPGVLVVANFDIHPHHLNMTAPQLISALLHGPLHDLYSDEQPKIADGRLLVPPSHFYWLTAAR